MAAVYLLLPRPRPYPALWGGAAGGLALLLAGMLLIGVSRISPEAILFYAFSAIAIVSAVLLITQSNPARAALSFALVVLSSCGLFLLLAAPFLAAATTIIYAGAIIVTFLFVLMLAQQHGRSDADDRSREPFLASLAGFVLLGALLYILNLTYQPRVVIDRREWEQNPDPQEAATAQEADRLFGGWTLNNLGDLARQASQQTSAESILQTLKNDEAFFKALLAALHNLRGGQEVRDLHLNLDLTVRGKWVEAKQLKGPEQVPEMVKVLEEIIELSQRAHTLAGRLTPSEKLPLSTLSGPPPNQPSMLDRQGNAPLPAENTAFLGRSLFTDYLLAVELGGTLLLVATIGAIAIASRREERRP